MEIGSLMGLDMDVWRVVTALGLLGSILLFVYRLVCIVDLMKNHKETLDSNQKIIYAGLIVFIPLALGAWLYEFVEKKKKVSMLFLIPFLIVIVPSGYAFLHMLPHATSFNLDYLSW